MQLGEIEKRQKGQDRQEKEIERGREREREKECVRDGWTTQQRERLKERPGGEEEEYGSRVCVKWEESVREKERARMNEE